MIEYPPVEHKLPELFQEIIKLDRAIEVINSSPVIDLKEYHENKKLRWQYSQAADKYVQRQKGNSSNEGPQRV